MEKEYSVGYQIKNLNNILERKIMSEAKKNHHVLLTLVQGKILKYLFCNKENKIYQKDIEKELFLRGSTLSGILNTMEKNELIVRLKYNDYARKKEIKLSDNGMKKMENMKYKIMDFEKNLRNNISNKE